MKPQFNFFLNTFFPLHIRIPISSGKKTMVPRAPTLSTTKAFPSHTSRSKTRPVFLSQYVDIFEEPNCDSTQATLHDKDESDPSPSPTVISPSNFPGTKKHLPEFTSNSLRILRYSSLKGTRRSQ